MTKPIARVRLPKSDRLTEPARKLLEKALTAMVRYPETVDMDDFYRHDPDVKPTGQRPEPYCGTVACLAGHVVIAAGRKFTRRDVDRFDKVAAKILALPRDETVSFAHRLFCTYNTATDEEYPISPRAQARAVVVRVKRWLRTGE